MTRYRLLLTASASLMSSALSKPVKITVTPAASLGPLPPFNQFFGCDEPNFAYFPQGSNLIKELGSLSSSTEGSSSISVNPTQPSFFRTHNLLTTGKEGLVGVPGFKFGSTNAYTLDSSGNPVFNFSIIDRIFDQYMASNVKPYVEVGFMPLALASNATEETYFFDCPATGCSGVNIFTDWSHEPKDFNKWEELVFQWATHTVQRYGAAEVNKWWWEIWNEPNIAYWNGTMEDFFALHDHAINAIRRALPSARVGGPDLAGGTGGTWLGAFLNHSLTGTNHATGKVGTPLDFISWHAKGAPVFVTDITSPNGGHVRMGIATQLQQIDSAFAVVASFPQLHNTPIVLGEYDPDGCAGCTDPSLGYRNGLHYPAYTAASFVRALDLASSRAVNLQGILTWAFEYEPTALIPNETAFFDGFRVLSTQGIDKAVLNVHRMWAMMTGAGVERIKATSDGQIGLSQVTQNGVRNGNQTDVGVLASKSDDGKLFVFVWHYHDDDLPFEDAQVAVQFNGLPAHKMMKLTHFRIDNNHSNAYAVWLSMGSPQPPSAEQFQQLVQSGKLMMLEEPRTIDASAPGGIPFALPIQSISLLALEPI